MVEWLNWQSWPKIYIAKLIFGIMCVLQLWLNWLNGLFSPKIPRKTQFSKNVCRKQWLNWLIRQIWILANSNFWIVCVAKAVEMVDLPLCSDYFLGWLLHLVVEWLNSQNSQKLFLANFNFQNVCVAKAVEMVDLPLFTNMHDFQKYACHKQWLNWLIRKI